jgi:hypothetical protein
MRLHRVMLDLLFHQDPTLLDGRDDHPINPLLIWQGQGLVTSPKKKVRPHLGKANHFLQS